MTKILSSVEHSKSVDLFKIKIPAERGFLLFSFTYFVVFFHSIFRMFFGIFFSDIGTFVRSNVSVMHNKFITHFVSSRILTKNYPQSSIDLSLLKN